ncbi:DUF3147 family protein [Acidicapsa ligni]|uniref:DUF3147 family protein n=1 Tax=Acidicapsa ligni TaxID=542300 RepID=UPI0021E0F4B0|nr:DUF3147 family protein [Acidicapsa ligni]
MIALADGEMSEMLIRFLVGGSVVTSFALISEVLRPKSFAGLFGAAPSIALATIGLTIAKMGVQYAAIEARSMIFGAIAFLVYASLSSFLLLRFKPHSLTVTVALLPVWLGAAFGIYFFSIGTVIR